MANTGLSAVWHDEGKRWEIRELPRPEIEPDGVSIRVRRTSVCGSDLHLWRGDGVAADAPRDPFVFGHEMMGTVAELGSKVTTDSLRRPLHEGDRVAFAYFFPCMRCYNCIRGEMGACKFRAGRKPLERMAGVQRRLRAVLLPARAPVPLQAAGRNQRRRRRADQLRPGPGHGGVPHRQTALRRQRRHPGRRRPRRQRDGRGARHGRQPRHRHRRPGARAWSWPASAAPPTPST